MTVWYERLQNDGKAYQSRRVRILIAVAVSLAILLFALHSWNPVEKFADLHYAPVDHAANETVAEVIDQPVFDETEPSMPNIDGEDEEELEIVDPAAPWTLPEIKTVDDRVALCEPEQQKAVRAAYQLIRQKYDHLRDDKFTIAIQTYKRPDELHKTLEAILAEPIPSLEEIVVVWGDLDTQPPADYVSHLGTPVSYTVPEHDSLNSRLIPLASYKTQAILLSDDDVYYHPSDMEFVFQTWRKFGRERLTGALARCSGVDSETGQYKYTFCSKNQDRYDMVLTNLAFAHISFLDVYSSDQPVMTAIREYVDAGKNCEDIAMNFVATWLTGQAPLQVNGHKRYFNMNPKVGISSKPGHVEARGKCINQFAERFHCMPLLDETALINRGVLAM